MILEPGKTSGFPCGFSKTYGKCNPRPDVRHWVNCCCKRQAVYCRHKHGGSCCKDILLPFITAFSIMRSSFWQAIKRQFSQDNHFRSIMKNWK